MTITRANVESVLVQRAGSFMAAVGMATTVAGSNASLNDPIGWALRRAGYSVSSLTSVADSDLAGLATTDTDKLLDLAEIRTLENVAGNLTQVDVTMGDRTDKFGQLLAQIEKRIERLRKQIEQDYGIGAGGLEVGLITHDFMAEIDE